MEDTNLSTIIDSEVKASVTNFCKNNGLKLRKFIEDAIVEKLEDEVDIQDFHARKNEGVVSFKDVFSE